MLNRFDRYGGPAENRDMSPRRCLSVVTRAALAAGRKLDARWVRVGADDSGKPRAAHGGLGNALLAILAVLKAAQDISIASLTNVDPAASDPEVRQSLPASCPSRRSAQLMANVAFQAG